jgi:hypothetical protein
MSQNYITLSRSALHELVWTKPVRDVAKEFGISDVALAKRCRALKIPLPARGYWAKVAAGQKPRRPALPPFTDRKRAVLPSYVTTRAADGTVATEPTVRFDPRRAATTVTVSEADLPTVTTAPHHTLQECSGLVKRTARHYKHPQRAELKFTRGQATGPILHLAVSPDMLDRALLFADALLRAAADQGWNPIPPREPEPPDPRHYYGRAPEPKPNPGPRYADLDVHGHRIEFLIEEAFDLRELPPTAAALAKQKQYPYLRLEKHHEKIWTGRLRLKRAGHHYPYGIDGKSWYDHGGRTVESLIPHILANFRAVAARMKDVDEQKAREAREREEQERRRQDIAARREANQALIHELERQAGAWARAQYLRRYLRAARRSLGDRTFTVDRLGQPVNFIRWAEHYVNQLDPLQTEPRDPDLMHETPHPNYYGNPADRDRFEKELVRLAGHTWERALKLLAHPTDNDSENHE